MLLNDFINNVHNEFESRGFVLLKKYFKQDLLIFLQHSANVDLNARGHEENGDERKTIHGEEYSIAVNHPAIGDYLLSYLTPLYSKISGKNLIPTYSYLRTYKKGSILDMHVDRPACQYSATLQINSDQSKKWLFQISTYEKYDIDSEIGDIILYKGEDVSHGRESKLEADWSTHIFLHWVDGDDENYKLEHYDQRPHLGYQLYKSVNHYGHSAIMIDD